ncbi:hypothetical protein D3C78_1837880 [compost metagenome]
MADLPWFHFASSSAAWKLAAQWVDKYASPETGMRQLLRQGDSDPAVLRLRKYYLMKARSAEHDSHYYPCGPIIKKSTLNILE